jgi:pyridoxal phosphate enzyme (YggS family)
LIIWVNNPDKRAGFSGAILMEIADNIARIRERIDQACHHANRDPAEIKLVAVTKNVPAGRIRDALDCGLHCFGENYVQEALPKIRELGPDVEWHFIGHLQRNKVKHVLGNFRLIHTVDRLSLAQQIEKRAPEESRIPVLLQVNIAGETTKSGVPPDELIDLLQAVTHLSHIRVCGLMTMPPFFDDPERARPYFVALREWRDRLKTEIPPPHGLAELSMGMTGDFEAAIEEGATYVRIGTAIFGPRPT